MLKQYLVYANTDLYNANKLDLAYQAQHHSWNTNSSLSDILYYLDKHREKFMQKKYSELHILCLTLDPATGVTEVTMNEYAANPQKQKTIINPAAATAKKAPMYMDDEEEEEELPE